MKGVMKDTSLSYDDPESGLEALVQALECDVSIIWLVNLNETYEEKTSCYTSIDIFYLCLEENKNNKHNAELQWADPGTKVEE